MFVSKNSIQLSVKNLLKIIDDAVVDRNEEHLNVYSDLLIERYET